VNSALGWRGVSHEVTGADIAILQPRKRPSSMQVESGCMSTGQPTREAVNQVSVSFSMDKHGCGALGTFCDLHAAPGLALYVVARALSELLGVS